MKPIFSIITVVYNGETTIRKTIESVLNQEKNIYEYLIIDGKSQDRTLSIINDYKDEVDLIVSERDEGIYDAMNKGVKFANGEWILFMNSGDIFCDRNVLENIKSGLNDSAEIVYGDTFSIIANKIYYIKASPLNNLIKKGMPFCHQSVFVKKKLLLETKFNTNYKILGDFDFFRKMYVDNVSFQHIPIPVSIFDNEGGLSFRSPLISFKEKNIITKGERSKVLYFTKLYLLILKSKLLKLIPESLIKMYRRHRLNSLYLNSQRKVSDY